MEPGTADPEATRYSRVYRGTGELIDHLLVSQTMADVVGDVRSLVEAADGGRLPSITDHPNRRSDTDGSDHARHRHLRAVTAPPDCRLLPQGRWVSHVRRVCGGRNCAAPDRTRPQPAADLLDGHAVARHERSWLEVAATLAATQFWN
ncbi:MAG: hypothetical protein M3353_05515 [Actinomycetota bacterium]|nr:hypothetical protein [Actinomycetota bacterium]